MSRGETVTPQDARQMLSQAYQLIDKASFHLAPRRDEDERDMQARREMLRRALVLIFEAM